MPMSSQHCPSSPTRHHHEKSQWLMSTSAATMLLLILSTASTVDAFTVPKPMSFSLQRQNQQPLIVSSHMVATSEMESSPSPLDNDNDGNDNDNAINNNADEKIANVMPELGPDGVYHILNGDQHKALLEANRDKLVVLKVFAPWCRACKGLEPKFNAIVNDKKYAKIPIIFADLTIQHNKDYVKSIGVLALPTVQFYVHGGRVDNFPCGPSKVQILKKKLAQFINANVDAKTLKVKELAGEQGFLADTAIESPPSKVKFAAPAPIDQQTDDATEQTSTTSSGGIISQYEEGRLRELAFLSDLSNEEFQNVMSKAQLLSFENGSIIMREGNKGRTFYVILDGEVEICQKTSLEDPLTTPSTYLGTVINRLSKFDHFGERALITGEPRAASIRAASKSTKCLAFDRDDFPATSVLSGKVEGPDSKFQLQVVNDKYGVALKDTLSNYGIQQILEASRANQVRGSANTPRPIRGVDTDDEDEYMDDEAESKKDSSIRMDHDVVFPLLLRFRLVRLVKRCFEYIMTNRPRFGEAGAIRRRNMLFDYLPESQISEFSDAYELIDTDGDGEITLFELRRFMSNTGEDATDDELMQLIQTSHQNAMDGKEVITREDFMGLMAESEFYQLFFDTFSSLDTKDSGFVKASDLDRALCGIRDLISDDRKSIIDVEDKDILIDYEQFSRMLIGSALK